jgi:ribose/xylose/arabinose/galactoside ABC-type transport system permease subunit
MNRSWLPNTWRAAQQFSLVAVLLAVGLIFSQLSDRFADYSNARNILLQSAPTIIGAVGMTFVIVTQGIDLSIGSIANLSLAAALVMGGTKSAAAITVDTAFWIYPIALACGVGLGTLNALAIIWLNITPLIATLGTLTLDRGLGLHLTGAGLLNVHGAVLALGRDQFLGIGLPIWLAASFVVVGWFVLAQTVFGRRLLALGGSPRSAAETGIRATGLLVIVYALSGLCGAISGLIVVGRVGVLTSELGFGFEFTVITAVMLGGTSLFGGRGNVVGSAIGAVLLTTIQNGLTLIGADPFIYDVVRGVILMIAVSLDTLTSRLSGRLSVAGA